MAAARIALVTGGASGIGRATARRLAADGDFVVVADINAANATESVRLIEAAGGRAAAVRLDVADAAAVDRAVDSIEREHGPVEVLVNCAGVLQNAARVEDMDLEEHDRVWAINYRGTYLCCRAWGPRMAARGKGAIVNIGSIAGLGIFPLPAYSPGKAAIHSLTRALAGDLGPRGVRVNAVAPGYVLTEALKARIEAGQRDPSVMEAQSTLGRIVTPEDIAEGIRFLVSDAARAITGITLPIDCGWLSGITYNTYSGLKRN